MASPLRNLASNRDILHCLIAGTINRDGMEHIGAHLERKLINQECPIDDPGRHAIHRDGRIRTIDRSKHDVLHAAGDGHRGP